MTDDDDFAALHLVGARLTEALTMARDNSSLSRLQTAPS